MKKLILLIIIVLGGLFTYFKLSGDKNMIKDEIKVLGFSYRMTNKQLAEENFATMQNSIQGLLQMHIPNLAENARMFVIYTDYDPNFVNDQQNSLYTTIIGMEVTSFANTPVDDIAKFTIKPGKYEVFETDKGPVNQVVYKKWQEIWNDKALLQKRTFTSDFDVYTGKENPMDAQIKIYIAVK